MIFLKKYWLFVLLAFLISVLIALKIILVINPPPPPLPEPNHWEGISPQLTTKKDLEKKLGQPLSTGQEEGFLIYYYPSQTPGWPTKVYLSFQENKVELVKEYFPGPVKTYNQFMEKLGTPDQELYGPHEGAGFLVFVFNQKGVALIANPDSGLVLEIWYFTPITLGEFLETWGKGLSLTPSKLF